MIWELLLELKDKIAEAHPSYRFISIELNGESFDIQLGDLHPQSSMVVDFEGSDHRTDALFKANVPLKVELESNGIFSNDEISMLSTYLPYALLPYFSKKYSKCYAITHFAQTLDGRIASFSGDSKCIGNDENLVHAHKMRALCDAILIGAKTLDVDNPRLTVRHVKGKNPTRVVIGGDELTLDGYHAIDENTIIFGQNHLDAKENMRRIRLKKQGEHYNVNEILQSLYDQGMHSVYIEGGAYTTSSFLRQQAIDQVQMHITPKILGSGPTGFDFDGIGSIHQAIEFYNFRFIPIGSHVMFVGELK